MPPVCRNFSPLCASCRRHLASASYGCPIWVSLPQVRLRQLLDVKRDDPISQWALALRERSGWQKAVVALANKNARILWAVMTKGHAFDARHVSIKPC